MRLIIRLACSVCGSELEVDDNDGYEITVKPCQNCEESREYRCSCGKLLELLDYDSQKTWIQFDECECKKHGKIHAESDD